MSTKIDSEIQARLAAVLNAGISDDAMKSINKKVDSIRCEIEDDVMYRLKDDLAPNLAAWVVSQFEIPEVCRVYEGSVRLDRDPESACPTTLTEPS